MQVFFLISNDKIELIINGDFERYTIYTYINNYVSKVALWSLTVDIYEELSFLVLILHEYSIRKAIA